MLHQHGNDDLFLVDEMTIEEPVKPRHRLGKPFVFAATESARLKSLQQTVGVLGKRRKVTVERHVIPVEQVEARRKTRFQAGQHGKVVSVLDAVVFM